MGTKITCTRCGSAGHDRGDWNGNWKKGVLIEIICPACQTIEENTEAVVKEATLDYGRDAFGRPFATMKGASL